MTLLANHCWADIAGSRGEMPRPCLFLDRDGVVIVDKHHLKDPDGVEIIRATLAGMHRARELGFLIGLVTNQSGIGQGIFRVEDFIAVQARIVSELAREGLAFDFVCACPFHPEAKPPFQAERHAWRKPEPGMLLYACEALNIDMSRSLIVGDQTTDLEAGEKAGLKTRVLLPNGESFYRPDGDAPCGPTACLGDILDTMVSAHAAY
jgi:D-glycero-D-manno-heptose 1,7-bisphosphate phosphatase